MTSVQVFIVETIVRYVQLYTWFVIQKQKHRELFIICDEFDSTENPIEHILSLPVISKKSVNTLMTQTKIKNELPQELSKECYEKIIFLSARQLIQNGYSFGMYHKSYCSCLNAWSAIYVAAKKNGYTVYFVQPAMTPKKESRKKTIISRLRFKEMRLSLINKKPPRYIEPNKKREWVLTEK